MKMLRNSLKWQCQLPHPKRGITSQASSPFNSQMMEAAGLAVGVVGLGLQLATALQTYVEGVVGAEDRLRDLSFDVASTASTLKQLEDMIDADEAVIENTSSDHGAIPMTLFTDQGRRDIYSLSRRCEKIYQGILGVIVNASAPPSAKGKAMARNVGLSDLTATRLAQFGRDLKWPWVEPRVKACQEELRWLKMDLLLHLQVANVARIHLQKPSKQVANSEDTSTLEAVAERLITQRAAYRKAALEGRRQRRGLANTDKAEAVSEPLLAASQKTASFDHEEKGIGTSQRGVQGIQLSAPAMNLAQEISSPSDLRNLFHPTGDPKRESSHSHVSDDTMKKTTLGKTPIRSNRSLHPVDGEDDNEDLDSTLLRGNSRPSSGHPRRVGMLPNCHPKAIKDEKITDDPFHIEAWTLPLPGVEPRHLPFEREVIMQRIQMVTKNGNVSAWDQFLALTPEQRDQVQDLVAQLGRADARPRSYLALETREDEIIVFVAVGQHEELVYLTDPIWRTWQFPYKDFKTWPLAKEQICLLEFKDSSLQQKIRDGHFNICAEFGALIPSMLWHQFVKPGKRLKMAMSSEHVPLSADSSSSSKGFFDKAVLKRLFTLRRRRAAQEEPRIQPHRGSFAPAYSPAYKAEYHFSRRTDNVSSIGAQMDHSQMDHPGPYTPVGPVGHGEPLEVESTKAEADGEDLFGWSDEEAEEDSYMTETFSQLLARLTNADKDFV